ncbi:hypothetical protein NMY22_g9469 [Coprinellus aureogranulatus]|nr:hypothetical protein NMY22_g9469 [Coprinellus aureogranulatus]
MSEETSQSAPMKIAVFGTRKYDQDSLKEANERAGNPLEFTFIDALLDHRTTVLASGHEGICIFVNDICDAAVLEQLHALGVRFVALRCAGFNNVDLKAAHNLGIKVARVPSYSPEAVAEFCVGMIMTVVRKYHKAYNRVREGNFLLDGLLGFNLNGKTIGIIGTGKIGLLTGRILSRGFQANVIAYDPYPNEKVAEEYGIKYVGGLDELLKESDIISLHCPLMESTKYIVSDATIPKMKKGVVLINTSRGGLIDTYALIRGLKSGHIAAVGLDVYERESSYFFADSSAKVIDDDTFARLLSFYNVFMTGHQAFLTVEALTNIADTTVLNLVDLKAKGTCACILGAYTQDVARSLYNSVPPFTLIIIPHSTFVTGAATSAWDGSADACAVLPRKTSNWCTSSEVSCTSPEAPWRAGLGFEPAQDLWEETWLVQATAEESVPARILSSSSCEDAKVGFLVVVGHSGNILEVQDQPEL